jgi:Leucine-rich repeat (LRR) protein
MPTRDLMHECFNDIDHNKRIKVKCVLSSLTGLQTLNLCDNSISDAGAASLACVLSSLTGLQTLDF